MLAKYATDKGLIFRMFKELKKLSNKTIPFEICKGNVGAFFKEDKMAS